MSNPQIQIQNSHIVKECHFSGLKYISSSKSLKMKIVAGRVPTLNSVIVLYSFSAILSFIVLKSMGCLIIME